MAQTFNTITDAELDLNSPLAEVVMLKIAGNARYFRQHSVNGSSVVMVDGADYGAVGDGVTDDTTAIQGALNSGASDVILPAPSSTYKISTISIPANVRLRGLSRVACSLTSTSTSNIITMGNGSALETLTVNGSGDTVLGASNVLMDGKTNVRIYNVGSYSAGFHGFALVNGSNNCAVIDCLADGSGHRGFLLDPTVYENQLIGVAAHDCTLGGILIGHGSHHNLVNTFLIRGTNETSLWLHHECYDNVILNGIIRQPADNTKTGIALQANAYGNILSNIHVGGYLTGVVLRGSDADVGYTDGNTRQNILTGLFLRGRGTGVSGGIAIKLESMDAGATVAAENHLADIVATDWESGVKAVNDGATDSNNNVFHDIDCAVNVTTAWNMGANPLSGSNEVSRLRGFATVAGGTATILSGTTSITVNHGLDYTPALDEISLTPGENPTNDPGPIWVSNIGATQLTINCKNNPGASNYDIGWSARLIN